jgi:hypothetical protein
MSMEKRPCVQQYQQTQSCQHKRQSDMTISANSFAHERMIHQPVSGRAPEEGHDTEYHGVKRYPGRVTREQGNIGAQVVAAVCDSHKRNRNPLGVDTPRGAFLLVDRIAGFLRVDLLRGLPQRVHPANTQKRVGRARATLSIRRGPKGSEVLHQR